MLGVAEAKRRFAELIDRVRRGETFVVSRRGRPVIALVPPGAARGTDGPPTGYAALAGALADWDELDAAVEEIYASRRRARDRTPDLA